MAKKQKKDKTVEAVNIKNQIEEFGCRIVSSLDDFNSPFYLKTGVFSLDLILSEGDKGGLGVGCTELFGEEGSGKTSLALSIAGEAQALGLSVYYINMERSITKSIVQCFPKLNPDKVTWIEPSHGQAVFNAVESILKDTKRAFVVVDSIPACISSAQLEEGAEKSFYAPIPSLLNTFMPKAKIYCGQSESILLSLNQLRDNISGYGPADRVPGGRAIKFYSDWRIGLKIKEKMKQGDEIIGHNVRAMVVKNRSAKPYQSTIIPLVYGEGFHEGMDILELALQFAIVKKSGSWYTHGEQKCQGEKEMAKYISDNDKVKEEIKQKIIELVK